MRVRLIAVVKGDPLFPLRSAGPCALLGVLFFLCVASLGEILYLSHLLVPAALFMVYLGRNHDLLSPVSTSEVFESKNYKHKNAGAGHNFSCTNA